MRSLGNREAVLDRFRELSERFTAWI